MKLFLKNHETRYVTLSPNRRSFSSTATMSTSKADGLMAEAKKKMESMMSWFSDSPFEEAGELYAQAASQYKAAKAYNEAGEAFIQAAKCAEKMKSAHERARYYSEAGQSFKKVPNLDMTAKCFEESINHHVDSNQFSQAAKLYQEMAELYLAQQQVDEAVDYYFKANDAFANANSATSGYQCLIKAADALVSQKQYKKAIGLYEKVAAQSYNDLGKWSVKEYFFKALLSQLANEQKEFVSNVEMTKTSMGKYMEEFPQFRDTREQQFVQKLIDAFEEESEEKFGDAVFEFDRISRLNPWFTALVAEVKKQLVKGDEADLL